MNLAIGYPKFARRYLRLSHGDQLQDVTDVTVRNLKALGGEGGGQDNSGPLCGFSYGRSLRQPRHPLKLRDQPKDDAVLLNAAVLCRVE
jgi:hypothetical protein